MHVALRNLSIDRRNWRVHSLFHRLGRPRLWLLAIGAAFLCAAVAGCSGGSSVAPPPPKQIHFVPNSYAFWSSGQNWTTGYGPAYADILLAPTNFLPCRGGPFALCYYSGPNSGSINLSCTLTPDGRYANCLCYDIPYGTYFVDINAILNHSVYLQTVEQCGADGAECQTVNSAPVCQAINQNKLIPGADLVSTFSFDCVPTDGFGNTTCSQDPYAGCMTAPCKNTGQPGIVQCSCPVYDGPYQVGQNDQECMLGGDLVWSAAYNPSISPATTTESADSAGVPTPTSCIPDAPGAAGCPLYVPGKTVLPPDSGVDCQAVCDEYHSCRKAGIQAGFTCDATLCTDQCTDRDLVKVACNGLSGCQLGEIIKAETAAQCSCCASQLCGCDADGPTDTVVASLVQQQRNRGITPQCDVNGTLCGSP